MKFIDNILEVIGKKGALFSLIFLGSFILNFFLPWWICALVAFLSAFWQANSAGQAFVVGATALTLLWGLVASYWHFSSQGILSDKVAGMLHLPNGGMLMAVVAIIAGLVGGNAALSGYLIRGVFRKG